MRVGIGYDAHPLVPGRNLVLGGIQIPYSKGLSGHSDADVLTHAIIDALLGATGLKDIGNQFPPEDPKYKNISSLVLLREVNMMIRSKGFKISNIDATIIAEEPRVAPFIDDMRNMLCQTLQIHLEQIMVKATTTDGLGSIGKGQGIACLASVSVE